MFANLEATATPPEWISLIELAALVGLPKSPAHRLR
ncbi:helix-turn-helix domain-containing protein [Novipirellula galeiformis]